MAEAAAGPADGAEAPATDTRPYPSAAAGWFLVVMLTLAYIFSFVDRYILGLLIEPIKAEFDLSDRQIGWLLSAFTLVYGFVGIFMGWMIDRGKRVWIVSIGIALWSAATVATGMAKNFGQLFAARMGVGVGEATLSPATFSMIGDSFPTEKRGKPIAFYSSALPIGAGIASLLSAAIIAWSASSGTQTLPLFGELEPWRFTLIVVGLPGIFFALFFLFMREPVRRPAAASADVISGTGFIDALKYIWRNKVLYTGFLLIICTMTAIAYSQGFLAPVFERTWGWSPEKYATINGIAILIIGPLNMLIMGSISDWWTSKGVKDASLRLLYIGFFIMVPTGAIPLFMPTAELAFAILCINTVGIGIVSAIGVTSLLVITPAQVRGQVVAIYYLAISWFGSLGPIAVGELSSGLFGEENLRYAVASVPIIFAVIPLIMMPLTKRLYREQMVRLGDSTE
ncbi:Major Facilitator Superfamily protein [Parasphingorhabdus marina DSM 22363]|uniref:Major Facilitator Superfamily protein n=1 Tax=Parasphingorhabdus marina DSM 22363 TaxID=1123272 RepID=A0A1N6CMM3_9SPHN|nr:MFS transporter [Parasphingorhabdus marina]SIN59742.1 Major Facilitator Superfamily protein [Parasphingorhabdus marina DSM 22363]